MFSVVHKEIIKDGPEEKLPLLEEVWVAPKVGPVYLYYSGKFDLDAPIGDAWSCILDYPTWQHFSLVEHVSGPRDRKSVV